MLLCAAHNYGDSEMKTLHIIVEAIIVLSLLSMSVLVAMLWLEYMGVM